MKPPARDARWTLRAEENGIVLVDHAGRPAESIECDTIFDDAPLPAFASPDYFQHIVPLIARLQPQGVEIGRLLHALEILAESEPRRAALNGHDGEPWKQWAKDFPKSHAFSDAAAALIVLLGEGTLTRWQGRIRLAPDAPVLDEEWLNADAFMALRLALAAPAETVQRRRTQHEQHFPALRELLLVA